VGYGLASLPQGEYAAGLAAGYNDWLLAEWLARDERLRASIVVAPQRPKLAAAEIDRLGSHPGFVQVILPIASPEVAWGHDSFDPIWEACVRNDLLVAFHHHVPQGRPNSSGWPRSYFELRCQYGTVFQNQLFSIVANGVFTKFPQLHMVFVEGGFSWVPGVMWRMDQSWRALRREVPWLTQRPSDVIREHVKLTTQPMEEPDDPAHLLQLIDMMGSDELLMFATDYPHWDFDSPQRALPSLLPKELREKIFWENAHAFYALPR
jgi:predicted TIM-barrel fold metal-dependent hydrolase